MNTTLSYAPVPPARRSWARVVKFAMLGIALACFGLGVTAVMGKDVLKNEYGPAWYGTPIAPANLGNKDSSLWAITHEAMRYYITATVLLGVFLLGQWLFLLPRGQWRIHLTKSHAAR